MSVKLPYWWKDLKNIDEQEQQKQYEKQYEQEPDKINPEFEEKPIVESTSNTSEDYHGGSELTFSIEDSETESQQESEESEELRLGDSSGESKMKSDSLNSDSSDLSEKINEGDSSKDQESNKSAGSSEEQIVENQESNDISSTEEQEEDVSDSSSESTGSDKTEEESTEKTTNHGSKEESETTIEQEESESKQETKSEQEDTDIQEESKPEQKETEESDEECSSESENGSDVLSTNYTSERQLNRDVELYKSPITRKLRTLFQRFIERIAEVETKYEILNGTQKLSVKQLMLRSINKRSLKSCFVDTYKESVILLIDTSGSMDWWADILSKISTLALERKDIEIYEAPNGLITRPVKSWEQLNEWYNWEAYRDFHNEFMEKTKNRIIIFIGDFDGGDTPYELAQNNKVYWICNEDRYWDTSDHNWCSHPLSEYPKNCKILWAYDEDDLIKVFSGIPTEQRVEEDYWEEEEDEEW